MCNTLVTPDTNLFQVSSFHHFLSQCAETEAELTFSEGSQPEEHDKYCMACFAGAFVQSNCPRQEKRKKKKNNTSALNGTIFLAYLEHAEPNTNALIIISPHKGLLSQLAAQQGRIFSPPVFLQTSRSLFPLPWWFQRSSGCLCCQW